MTDSLSAHGSRKSRAEGRGGDKAWASQGTSTLQAGRKGERERGWGGDQARWEELFPTPPSGPPPPQSGSAWRGPQPPFPPTLPAHSQGLTGRWLKVNLVGVQGGGEVRERAGGRDARSYHGPTTFPPPCGIPWPQITRKCLCKPLCQLNGTHRRLGEAIKMQSAG